MLGTLEEYVPENHLVRKLEETIDWGFIYPKVSSLYSDKGRPSVDPVILFKMIFINYTFGINSMRKTCEEIKVIWHTDGFLGQGLMKQYLIIRHGARTISGDTETVRYLKRYLTTYLNRRLTRDMWM